MWGGVLSIDNGAHVRHLGTTQKYGWSKFWTQKYGS